MLESVHEFLPVSGTEQDLVSAAYATFHLDLGCTGDQLKKKLNKLCRMMILTGNPNIPPNCEEGTGDKRVNCQQD
jgi:hypothetical protein